MPICGLTQTNTLLYSKPHASITSKATRRWALVVHSHSVASSAAIASTGNAFSRTYAANAPTDASMTSLSGNRMVYSVTPVINITSALPAITDAVSIDGAPNRVEIHGPGVGFFGDPEEGGSLFADNKVDTDEVLRNVLYQ